MAYLTIDEQILINRWAQGLEDDSAVFQIYRQWRERGDDILPHVAELAGQASPNEAHIEMVIAAVPFKATRSACCLLRKGINAETFFKLRNLKGRDAEDSFWIFLHLLKIADHDRKSIEAKCSHWWHRDLSDPSVIQDVKRAYEAGNL